MQKAATQAPAEPEYDLDEIWSQVFEMGEDIKSSFNLIRSGATLVGINDTEFKVIAHSEFAKSYIESNRQDICDIMERIVGRRLKMVCRSQEQTKENDDGGFDNLAKEVEEKLNLGITVRVE